MSTKSSKPKNKTIFTVVIVLISAILLVVGIKALINNRNAREETAQTLWNEVKDKSWDWNGFAGGTYTFYESEDGSNKCIVQAYGSGVWLTGDEIFDVELKNDTITVGEDTFQFEGEELIEIISDGDEFKKVLSNPGEIKLINLSGKEVTLEDRVKE